MNTHSSTYRRSNTISKHSLTRFIGHDPYIGPESFHFVIGKKKRICKLSKMKKQLLKGYLDNHTKWSQGRSFSR